MAEPAPGGAVYPVVFIDVTVKIGEGKVANRPMYVAAGVTVDRERDILGSWCRRRVHPGRGWVFT